jgi:hypothetical protein
VLFAVVGLPSVSSAADLYTQDFDVDDTANWTINSTYYDVPESNTANFFFDYSTVGIPSAPNSTGGSTRGMNLQANQDFDNDGLTVAGPLPPGFSVSPTGQDFSAAGDYKLTFDWWPNFPGPFPAGSNGTSQLSGFGIGTSGTFDNYPGHVDGVWFATTPDGGSSADYRAYGPERGASYQFPIDPAALDGIGNPIDGHATYYAGGRNNSATPIGDFNANLVTDAADYTRWRDNLGSTVVVAPALTPARAIGNANGDLIVDQEDYDAWKADFGNTLGLYARNNGGASAPAAQTTLFAQQTGTVALGAPGMEWHEVEISKVGNIVSWIVDGDLLISVDMTDAVTPLGGGNILFGHSDINLGASNDPLRTSLLFTLIDNVKVTTIPPGSGAGAGAVGVPEPSALLLVFAGVVGLAVRRRRK